MSGDEPDQRSGSQRRHDALVDAALRLLRSGTLPAAGGVALTILVGVGLDDLRGTQTSPTPPDPLPDEERAVATDAAPAGSSRAGKSPANGIEDDRLDLSSVVGAFSASGTANAGGVAHTAHGAVWSMRQLILSACEAAILPVVFNDAGGILAYGRTSRLASPGQRLALFARDRGCVFPGCDAPAAWCEVATPRPTTSSNGSTAAPRTSKICACSAATTTATSPRWAGG